MNHKNLLFILNPNAGKGEIRSKMIRILQLFSAAGYDSLVSPTLHAGEIPEIIQRRANGVDLIVCCGGDGTLNETVTGLMQLDPRPPLGYLPAGTVNDFASSLGFQKIWKLLPRRFYPVPLWMWILAGLGNSISRM